MELRKLIKMRWDSSAIGYSESVRTEIEREGEKWKEYIKKNINPKPGEKILETCCGPGFLSILLSGEDRKITAVDECEAMLDEARKNAKIFNADIDFMNMDCHKMDFEDKSFDMVISRNSLWTMYNPGEAYKEWVRVLKPGGRLIVFESSWCLEYRRKDVLEKKVAFRMKNNLPATESHYVGNMGLAQELDARCMLGNEFRPDWDVAVLDKMKMEIEVDEDAWEKLWDDETKKLFGYAPMFMIHAVKT